MAILDVLNKPFFSSRFKLPVHCLQVVLVTITIGLSVPRLFMKNQPRTRTGTIALGMGAKSLIILAYIILSEEVARFRRWHSYKAVAILSCLEVVFWSAVAGLVFQGNINSCQGITCTLSWVVFVVAILIVNTEIYASAIAIREFREYKRGTKGLPVTSMDESTRQHRHRSDEEMMMQQHSARAEQPKQAYAQAAERQHSDRSRSQGWQSSEQGRPQRGHYAQPPNVSSQYSQQQYISRATR